MSTVIQIIQQALPKCDAKMSSGRLTCRTEVISDAAQALAVFTAFGGDGWLCATDHREIRRFNGANTLQPPVESGAWPLCGEAVAGDISLHLQRGGEEWHLTTIRRVEAEQDDDIILTTILKARDGRGDLRYETAWGCRTVAGMEELRPQAFRFVGFEQRREV